MLEKMIELVQRYGNPIAAKMNSIKVICAVRDGMAATIPLTIVGAIFLIAMQFPYLDQFAPAVSAWLMTNCWQTYVVCFSSITIFALVGTAHSYGEQLGVNPMYSVFVAVVGFMMLSDMSTGIPQNIMTADGLFAALLVAILSVRLYALVVEKNLVIKMPDSVPPNIATSFTSIIPFAVVVVVTLVVRLLMLQTPYQYVFNLVTQIFTKPLMEIGTGVVAATVFVLIQQLLWWFGIHGANIIMAVYQPVLMAAAAANVEAMLAGTELPFVLSYASWFVITPMFNAAIPWALTLFGKSERVKAVGKMSLVPAQFCIHEPLFFGLPVILNPMMFLPFVVGYTGLFVLSYFMMASGLFPVPTATIPWTTPPIIGGLISTNFNIMGALMQIILVVLAVLMYAPFVKALDKQYLEEESENN